ncbi:MAG: hypothetical protein R3F48_13470 [Candidatus Zixiibacteriota bacterium]
MNHKTTYKLSDVFGISSKVPVTYVERPYVDTDFLSALNKDKHIVVYGCSKQGKTSLRKMHIDSDSFIAVQCFAATTREMLYAGILKEAGVEISKASTEKQSRKKNIRANVSGEASAFIAKAKGNVESGYETGQEESITKKYLEIDPGDPNDIIRTLDEINFNKNIIIEDFHYLGGDVQEAFAADMKVFYEKTDKFRIIIIGVWMQPGKLTRLNGDLEGRISYVNADRWEENELLAIIKKGEQLLNIEFSQEVIEKMLFFCQHNVGLLQQIAEYICERVGVSKTQTYHLSILDDSETERYRETSTIEQPSDNITPPVHLITTRGKEITDKETQLNFHGGPINKWLSELSRERGRRYASFLRDFANGPQHHSGNMFRWIAYAIISASDNSLKTGLNLNQIYKYVLEISEIEGLKGDFKIQKKDVRFALHEIRSLHRELQIQPPILDYDATEDILRIVDSGFILYHATQSKGEMLVSIGLDV